MQGWKKLSTAKKIISNKNIATKKALYNEYKNAQQIDSIKHLQIQ